MSAPEAAAGLGRLGAGPQPPEPPEEPARAGRRAPAGLAAAGGAVSAAVLLPAAYLVIRASGGGAPLILDVVADAGTLGLLARTSALAAGVTAAAAVIGVALAWLTARTDLPGRRTWFVLTSLPLVVPSYVAGFTFVAALGPRGALQGWLEPFGVERLPSIYGFPGAWLVLTAITYPYVLLPVRAAVRGLDPSLEDASITLGRSGRGTFFKVVLPHLRPAIASGCLLVALYTMHDFGAVSLLRFDSFTRAIYVQYRGSFDRTPAAILALVLVVLTLVVLWAERRTRGRAGYHRLHGSGTRPAPVVRLGRWRWAVLAACTALVGLALVLPLTVVGYWLVSGIRAGEPLGLTLAAAGNSLQASVLGAAAALVAAWPVAVLSARYPGALSRFVETASHVGYALPGIVVALALVFFGARYAPALYQTRAILAFAYVVLFLPQAVGALRASLLQVSPSLEEAARSLGSSRLDVVRRVVLPLATPGILAGGALVFLTAMKELPATLLLAPTGFATLATRVWSATNDVLFGRAAAPALALVILSSLPLAVLVLRERAR